MIASGVYGKVQEYIDDVLSGNIVTSVRVRNAVARQVADIERQSTSDFPFHFDAKLATKVCNFFPTMLRHSIGPHAGHPFELEPWQAFSDWCLFGWKRDSDNTRRFRKAYLSMARKNGKALALDTLLPTPNGFTTMGDVQKGDYLIGMDGKPVLVEAVTEIMQDRPCYRMVFSTGESVVCDADHEWLTSVNVHLVGCKGVGRKFFQDKEAVRTTEAISESVFYGKRNDRNHSVQLVQSVCFSQKDLPVKPYTLGAWLGDGNTDSPRITCSYEDREILDRIEDDGYDVCEQKSANANSGLYSIRSYHGTSKKNIVQANLKELGVLGRKHIPIQYLRSSYSQRLSLLRGLMDTDGTTNRKGQCEFVSIHKNLAEDVAELISSLGQKATILEHDAKLNGVVVSKKYRVYFFAFRPFIPFSLARKASRIPERNGNKKQRSNSRQIASCEQIESVPVKCVQVAGGMYCCTRSFIPTHNSTDISGKIHYLASADIDPVTGKPEAIGQILLTATKKDQAKVVYGEADRMRLQSPTLCKMTDVRYETITYKHNGSYIRMVTSDKPFDGLNPHVVVMDELHAWGEHHRKFYDTMVTGSASRSQPLHLIITTAGDDQSHLWLEEYNYACKVVDGIIDDETLFALIYELDEKDNSADESCWIKANPNLGVSIQMDYLRQRWSEDKHTALGINRFTRYHGNRVVTSTEKAFDLDAWDKCAGELSDWKDSDASGAGADLGGRNDLAAIGLCARFRIADTVNEAGNSIPVYRYELRCRSFIADDTTRDLTKLPFATWVHLGLIRKSKYAISDLVATLIDDCQEHEIQTVAYDPYNGQQLGDSLTKEGIVAARMAQNQSNFNEAIRDFQQLITEGRIRHDGNPLLRWCVSNAIIARDRQDRWMFDKRTSNEKIDPLVAVVMAYRVASLQPERARGSLYL